MTPQYFLPERDNILHVDLPLHRVTRDGLDAPGREWESRFAQLPHPWWSVLLGGDSGPFVFTPDKARHMAGWLNRRVAAEGGSVLLTNSARTPASAWAAFRDSLTVPNMALDESTMIGTLIMLAVGNSESASISTVWPVWR